MAIDPNNQIGGVQNSTDQNTPVSGSPWEEELDLPETPSKKEPAILGSLDPSNNTDTEQPVPFNVPQNIEEKVGQKVPAENYIVPKEPAIVGEPMSIAKPAVPANENIPVSEPLENMAKIETVSPTQPDFFAGNVSQSLSEAPSASLSDQISNGGGPSNPPVPPKPKKNIFNVFSKFSRKKTPVTEKSDPVLSAKEIAPAFPPSPFENKGLLPEKQKSEVVSTKDLTPAKRFNFFKNSRRLVPVFGVLVFFVFLIGLTELGLLSLGVEKIYGAVGLEKIWGGLSANPEQAFLKSALEMQKHPNFKISGNITMSVDSSIDSPITSPLLSAAVQKNTFAKKDQNVSRSTKAIKTATDSTDDIYDMYDQSTSTDSSTDSTVDTSEADSSESSSSTADTSSSDSSSSADNSSSSDTTATSSSSDFTDETDTIQEISASFQTKSNVDSLETNVSVNGASETSEVDLLLNNDNLLVKSSAFKFSNNDETDKWLSYSIASLKEKSLQNSFFSINSDSGVSVIGERSSNEKIGGVRCYKYAISSIEIGSALSSIGITSDMVQGISGDIWIGVNDKLIRKADLKFITPVSSSVSSFTITLEFSDFDVENKISLPDDSEIKVVSESASNDQSVVTTTSKDQQRKSDVAKLLDALKEYKKDHNSYPTSNSLLKLNTTDNMIKKALVPEYISEWPADPVDGWYYAYKSDGKKCSISARLENPSDSEGQIIGGVFLYLKYNNE
ncbi:MAG: type II secretion system protein GspG [Patescibacteria group bacterium]